VGLVNRDLAERWLKQAPEQAEEALDAAEGALLTVKASAQLPRVAELRAALPPLRRACGVLP